MRAQVRSFMEVLADLNPQLPCEEQVGDEHGLLWSSQVPVVVLQNCQTEQADEVEQLSPLLRLLERIADKDRHNVLSSPALPVDTYPAKHVPHVFAVE